MTTVRFHQLFVEQLCSHFLGAVGDPPRAAMVQSYAGTEFSAEQIREFTGRLEAAHRLSWLVLSEYEISAVDAAEIVGRGFAKACLSTVFALQPGERLILFRNLFLFYKYAYFFPWLVGIGSIAGSMASCMRILHRWFDGLRCRWLHRWFDGH